MKDLLDRFVGVRLVRANDLDLDQFQFDFDLTFAVFFLHPDGTVYGRYGSKPSHTTIPGFRAAMEAALALHAAYPENKTALAGKRARDTKFRDPRRYPALKHYRKKLDYDGEVVKSCMHCHQIRDAEREMRRAKRTLSGKDLFPWPLPDTLGLRLDPETRATVASSTVPGLAAGDEIATIAGQPVTSLADVQWVLHRAEGDVPVTLGDGRTATLPLPEGWRRKGDLSWRVSTWELRRMALGGMVLIPQVGARSMRLLANHVGRYGRHGVARRAGFRKGDVIVSFAGNRDPLTESELLVWILETKAPGARADVEIERGGERKTLRLRLP